MTMLISLAAGVLGVAGADAEVPAPATASPAAAQHAAEFAEAKKSGEPVEIEAERTTTDTVFANPSGTFTLETATTPVRVLDGKSWKAIDLDLEVDGDVLRPRAALGNVELSAGGNDLLVAMNTGSVRTTTRWPGELPKPTLDGATATYADVFPNVDLRLTVTEVGVSQVLVVHDAQAAEDPSLESLVLEADVEGGTLESKDGGYVIRDRINRTVGVSTAPLMWDSSGTVLDLQREPVADTSELAIEQRSSGPAQGDEIDEVDLAVTDDTLTLSPAPTDLAGPDVHYPVFIDPTATSAKPQAWGMVFKQVPSSSFYKWTDSNGQGVGHQNYNGVSTKRLFFQHSVSSVRGKQILDASFKATMNWSASCATRSIKVYRVSSSSSGHTWNKQPSWGAFQDSRSVSAGWADCNPGGREVAWDVTRGVREIAAANRSSVAFGMRASDETDPLSWRRFRHTTVLRVVYNTPPLTPTKLKIGNTVCPDKGVVTLNGPSSSPIMSAEVNDPDKQNVSGGFRWSPGTSLSSNYTGKMSSAVASGQRASWAMPLRRDSQNKLVEGPMTFRVYAEDTADAKSGLSAQCTVYINPFPAGDPSIEDPLGGTWGKTGPVTVRIHPNEDHVADTSGYAFTLDSDAAPRTKTHTPTTGDKILSLTIGGSNSGLSFGYPAVGKHVLRAWAYDAQGYVSQKPAVHEFQVVSGPRSVRYLYEFDGSDSEATKEASGDGPSINIGGALRSVRAEVTDEDGTTVFERDHMLEIGSSTTPLPQVIGPLIQSGSESFSLAALLDPADAGVAMTAISLLNDSGVGIAELGVEPQGDGYDYVFKVRDADSGQWVVSRMPGEDSSLGTTLVIASYDAESKSLAFYGADGIEISGTITNLPGSVPAPTSTQKVLLGADAQGLSRWTGAIDNLLLAGGNRLSDEEISQLPETGAECYMDGCN